MIQESYCSFKIAQLLKEKGFDVPTQCAYKTDGRFKNLLEGTSYWDFGLLDWNHTNDLGDYGIAEWNGCISCPTHQIAMKWLRKKGIYIYIQPTKYLGGALYGFQSIIEDGRDGAWVKYIHHAENYEEAVEAALKYSLENLI